MEFGTPEFKTRYLSQVKLVTPKLIRFKAILKVPLLPLASGLIEPDLNGEKG